MLLYILHTHTHTHTHTHKPLNDDFFSVIHYPSIQPKLRGASCSPTSQVQVSAILLCLSFSGKFESVTLGRPPLAKHSHQLSSKGELMQNLKGGHRHNMVIPCLLLS